MQFASHSEILRPYASDSQLIDAKASGFEVNGILDGLVAVAVEEKKPVAKKAKVASKKKVSASETDTAKKPATKKPAAKKESSESKQETPKAQEETDK